MTTTTKGEIQAVMLTRFKGANFDAYDEAFREGLITGKSKILLIAAKGLSFVPAPGDLVTIDGVAWRIAGCTALNPAGVPLVYTAGIMLT